MIVASAASASTATDTSKENLGFKVTNTSYCKCCINLSLNSLTRGENSNVPVYKACLLNYISERTLKTGVLSEVEVPICQKNLPLKH